MILAPDSGPEAAEIPPTRWERSSSSFLHEIDAGTTV
jgi:hypothetical protein